MLINKQIIKIHVCSVCTSNLSNTFLRYQAVTWIMFHTEKMKYRNTNFIMYTTLMEDVSYDYKHVRILYVHSLHLYIFHKWTHSQCIYYTKRLVVLSHNYQKKYRNTNRFLQSTEWIKCNFQLSVPHICQFIRIQIKFKRIVNYQQPYCNYRDLHNGDDSVFSTWFCQKCM